VPENNVALFRPKARAKMRPDTGGLALSIPVELDGEKHSVDIGVTLMGGPIDALTADPQGSKKLKEAVFEAMTGTIQARVHNQKQVTSTTLPEAVAAVVERKMKETL